MQHVDGLILSLRGLLLVNPISLIKQNSLHNTLSIPPNKYLPCSLYVRFLFVSIASETERTWNEFGTNMERTCPEGEFGLFCPDILFLLEKWILLAGSRICLHFMAGA